VCRRFISLFFSLDFRFFFSAISFLFLSHFLSFYPRIFLHRLFIVANFKAWPGLILRAVWKCANICQYSRRNLMRFQVGREQNKWLNKVPTKEEFCVTVIHGRVSSRSGLFFPYDPFVCFFPTRWVSQRWAGFTLHSCIKMQFNVLRCALNNHTMVPFKC